MTFCSGNWSEFFGGSLRPPVRFGVGVGRFLAVFDRQNVKMRPVLVLFLITCLPFLWSVFDNCTPFHIGRRAARVAVCRCRCG